MSARSASPAKPHSPRATRAKASPAAGTSRASAYSGSCGSSGRGSNQRPVQRLPGLVVEQQLAAVLEPVDAVQAQLEAHAAHLEAARFLDREDFERRPLPLERQPLVQQRLQTRPLERQEALLEHRLAPAAPAGQRQVDAVAHLLGERLLGSGRPAARCCAALPRAARPPRAGGCRARARPSPSCGSSSAVAPRRWAAKARNGQAAWSWIRRAPPAKATPGSSARAAMSSRLSSCPCLVQQRAVVGSCARPSCCGSAAGRPASNGLGASVRSPSAAGKQNTTRGAARRHAAVIRCANPSSHSGPLPGAPARRCSSIGRRGLGRAGRGQASACRPSTSR